MKANRLARLALVTIAIASVPCFAADKLTLADAEKLALNNHPSLRAAELTAEAAQQLPREARSAMLPTLQGNLTGVDAQPGTRIAAGGLNNPTILERYANGLTISQLITDFGRTQNLVRSARANAAAAQADANVTRESVLLDVDRAYYAALRAQAVRTVARDAVAARQLLADQVNALAKAKLKSALDVSFANVALAQAQLSLAQAENDVQASMAELSTALGYETPREFELADDSGALPPPPDWKDLIPAALANRPDIAREQFKVTAAQSLATAERDLSLPSISAIASGGLTPYGDSLLNSHYGAVGFNVTLPVFNGFNFSARHREAQFKERAQEQRLRAVSNQVARDVKVAWLNADTAYGRLGLTAKLLDESKQALDLAQSRYKLGLSSIVEVSQAQLAETQAEIEQASARYEYLTQAAALNYQIGKLR